MSSVFDLVGKYDNLHDPVPFLNTRPAIFGLIITFLILSWTCAVSRLYTRFVVLNSPGWDDAFVILVMLTTLVLSLGTCLATEQGLGKHFLLLGLDGMPAFVKAFYIPNATYAMSTAFIKLALLFQYLRIFERGTKVRFLTIFFIVVTSCWGFAYSFIAWVPCWPVTAYWDWSFDAVARWGFGSHDVGIFVGTYISHVAGNVVLDLIVFAIPVPLYFSSTSSKKSRWGICFLVVLGLIVNILSVWRLVSIIDTQAGTSPTLDPSWYGSAPIVLAALEVNLAVICASLPVFWPVLEHNIGKIFITHEIEISHEEGDSNSLSTQDTELRLAPRHQSPEPVHITSIGRNYDTLHRFISTSLGGESKVAVSSPRIGTGRIQRGHEHGDFGSNWPGDKKSSSERSLVGV
ncbi:hypothetical protein GQ53DRAFT_884653 [Thozetella sp. PMI_491]|nr:hypothetical protein GQ53DRAFT_884653 [Thozetella sp. PMI_491]